MRLNIGTLEITDEQAYGVGLAEGQFRKGTRKEIKHRLVALVNGYLDELAAPVAELTEKFDLNSDDGDSSD